MKSNIKKYDIWLVNLEPTIGSEQAGVRPCLVIQNNVFFQYQNTTILLPITSKKKKNQRESDFKYGFRGGVGIKKQLYGR